jgi:hypothetical protein
MNLWLTIIFGEIMRRERRSFVLGARADIDRYDFAVRVEFQNGRPIARIERAGAAPS